MVALQVFGHDTAVAFANAQGPLQLNVYKPLILHDVLQSARLLDDAVRCVHAVLHRGLAPRSRPHRRAPARVADAGHGAGAAHRLLACRRDRHRRASRPDPAARGGTGLGPRRGRRLRQLGQARRDGPAARRAGGVPPRPADGSGPPARRGSCTGPPHGGTATTPLTPSRASPASDAVAASSTAGRIDGRCAIRRRWRGFAGWPFRRRGPTCGSRCGPTATCRPPAATSAAASSIAITPAGRPSATRPSTRRLLAFGRALPGLRRQRATRSGPAAGCRTARWSRWWCSCWRRR